MKSRTISQQQYDNAVAALQSAEADLHRAEAAVNEVQATLDWATIRSPIDGTVIDKKVDVGDMVTPGQMLVTLFDPKHMQLVASVRESLDAAGSKSARASACRSRDSTNNAAEPSARSCPKHSRPAAAFR